MAFNKSFLTSHGVPEDQVEAILSERSRTLNDYIPKTDVQAQVDAAVKAALDEAQKTTPDVTKAPEYVALQGHLKKLETLQTDDFKGLKAKFRDDAWSKLDHEKPYAEQMTAFKEQYPEYWEAAEPPTEPKTEPKKTPVFSADTGRGNNPMTEEEKVAADFRQGFFGNQTTQHKKE